MKRARVLFGTAAGLAAVALGASAALLAQANEPQGTYVALRFTPGARTAASTDKGYPKIKPVFSAQSSDARATRSAAAPKAAPSQTEAVGYGALRYPADVHYFGGPTVANAQMHAIFMQPEGNVCAISACWGNPEGMLRDLGRSDYIHVADQYVGETSDNRYTVGQGYQSFFHPQAQPFTDADMQAIVTAAAQASGQVGYEHIYHVFLPPGVDECTDSTFTICYSPDNLATYGYCAYHFFFDVPGLGHLLYTVEPYQNVFGCNDIPGTPNGAIVDSTNDALLHETFETISDPDVTGWWNLDSRYGFQSEIGDFCEFAEFDADGTFLGFIPSIWSAEGHVYATQPIYNNDRHACTTAP